MPSPSLDIHPTTKASACMTSREDGTNPRALGTNERATVRNKWALRNWKKAQRLPPPPAPTWDERLVMFRKAVVCANRQPTERVDPRWARAMDRWRKKAATIAQTASNP